MARHDRLLRAPAEPLLDVRPCALLGAITGHDADMASMIAIDLGVRTADLRKNGLRLAGRCDVVAIGDDCQQIRPDPPQVHALPTNHELAFD